MSNNNIYTKNEATALIHACDIYLVPKGFTKQVTERSVSFIHQTECTYPTHLESKDYPSKYTPQLEQEYGAEMQQLKRFDLPFVFTELDGVEQCANKKFTTFVAIYFSIKNKRTGVMKSTINTYSNDIASQAIIDFTNEDQATRHREFQIKLHDRNSFPYHYLEHMPLTPNIIEQFSVQFNAYFELARQAFDFYAPLVIVKENTRLTEKIATYRRKDQSNRILQHMVQSLAAKSPHDFNTP